MGAAFFGREGDFAGRSPFPVDKPGVRWNNKISRRINDSGRDFPDPRY
jgi:hypothetical protein